MYRGIVKSGVLRRGIELVQSHNLPRFGIFNRMSSLLPRKGPMESTTSAYPYYKDELEDTVPGIRDVLAPGAHSHLLRRLTRDEEIQRPIYVTHTQFGDRERARGDFETEPTFAPEFDRRRLEHSFWVIALRVPQSICHDMVKLCRATNALLDLRLRTVVNDVPSSYFPPHAGQRNQNDEQSNDQAREPATLSTTHRRLLLAAALPKAQEVPRVDAKDALAQVPEGTYLVDPAWVKEHTSLRDRDQFWTRIAPFLDAVAGAKEAGAEASNTSASSEDSMQAAPSDSTQQLTPAAHPALNHKVQFVLHTVTLGYEFFSATQVLRTLLPANVVTPTSFATSGHIAHLNLRAPQLPFRRVIGEVLLEKSPGIRTVLNKLGTINNKYRNFAAEIIAGDRDTVTSVREQNATLEFDFAKVYWNSRLSAEHERVVNLISPSEAVMDPFAGVGPFAVPAALRGARVFANDLNPDSSRSMRRNAYINKVDRQLGGPKVMLPNQRRMSVWNTDARLFIRAVARIQLEQVLAGGALGNDSKTRVPWFHHVVMNLPASAVQFLDTFRGLYTAPVDYFPGLPKELPLDDKSRQTISKTQSKQITNLHDVAGHPSVGLWCLDSLFAADDALVPRKDVAVSLGLDPASFDGFVEMNKIELKEFIPSNASGELSALTTTELVEKLRSTAEKAGLAGKYKNAVIKPPTLEEIRAKCSDFVLPIVHCYCFTRDIDNPHEDALQQAEKYLSYTFTEYHKFLQSRKSEEVLESKTLNFNSTNMSEAVKKSGPKTASPSQSPYATPEAIYEQINKYGVHVHYVRNVAPHKIMMCVSFRLPYEVAFEDWSSAEKWFDDLIERTKASREQGENNFHEEDDDDDEYEYENEQVQQQAQSGPAEGTKRVKQI